MGSSLGPTSVPRRTEFAVRKASLKRNKNEAFVPLCATLCPIGEAERNAEFPNVALKLNEFQHTSLAVFPASCDVLGLGPAIAQLIYGLAAPSGVILLRMGFMYQKWVLEKTRHFSWNPQGISRRYTRYISFASKTGVVTTPVTEMMVPCVHLQEMAGWLFRVMI